MKVKLILGALIVPILINAQLKFQKTVSSGQQNEANSVIQTSDKGFVMAGLSSNTVVSSFPNAYLVKLDSNSNFVWGKTFGGIYTDIFYSVKQTNDGGYICAGESSSFGLGSGDKDIYLVKTDANGNLVWAKNYGGTNEDVAYSVIQTSDGGYALTGYSRNYPTNSNDKIYILKTDNIGNVVWSRTIFGGQNDRARSIIEIGTGGGYMVAGYYTISGTTYPILVNLQANGTVSWVQAYNTGSNAAANSVIAATGGGYVMCGYNSANADDILLIKTYSNGNIKFGITFGGSSSERAYDVKEATDKGYVITGNTPGSSFQSLGLLKTDSTGVVQWKQGYGGVNGEIGFSLGKTNDGGYVAAGYKAFASGGIEFYVVKTDADGVSGCNEFTPTITQAGLSLTGVVPTPTIGVGSSVGTNSTVVGNGGIVNNICNNVGVEEFFNSDIKIFPNPASQYINIESSTDEQLNLHIYNLIGEKVAEQLLDKGLNRVDINQLVAGIYICKLIDHLGNVLTIKIIVEK